MAEEMRPASPQQAPDPSDNYERAHPDREAGMGRLDNNDDAVPANAPEQGQEAVKNKHDPTRQVNGQDSQSREAADRQSTQGSQAAPAPQQPDHSMHEEEPDGWDMAPTDIHDKRRQRHPRTEGKGGTP
jgi:hypothetical protein